MTKEKSKEWIKTERQPETRSDKKKETHIERHKKRKGDRQRQSEKGKQQIVWRHRAGNTKGEVSLYH